MNSSTHENIKYASDIDIIYKVMQSPPSYTANHWHNSLEISYILEGEDSVRVNQKRRQLPPGSFAIVNPREIHSFSSKVWCRSLLVQIPYSYLKKYIPEIDSIKFYISPTLKDPLLLNEVSKIRQDLYALCQLYPLPSPDAQLKVHSIIFDILYHLKHSFSKEISPDEAGAASMKYMNRLGQIAAFIREHYMENLTLDEVAGYVNLNPDYFTRFFKKYMGMTFLEYLNSIRMENLFMDLMDTDLSIQQLLSIHGFTNYKLFMKMFRARYGTTPNELRKSSRQHGPGHAM